MKKQNSSILLLNLRTPTKNILRIKQAAHEEVKGILTNSKILLNFATASVIESLRINRELCDFVLNDISNDSSTTSYGSNCLSLMVSGQQQQQQQQSFSYLNDDICIAVILEQAEKLYNMFITKLTDSVMAAAAIRDNIIIVTIIR
jgi:hypothetical protein